MRNNSGGKVKLISFPPFPFFPPSYTIVAFFKFYNLKNFDYFSEFLMWRYVIPSQP